MFIKLIIVGLSVLDTFDGLYYLYLVQILISLNNFVNTGTSHQIM